MKFLLELNEVLSWVTLVESPATWKSIFMLLVRTVVTKLENIYITTYMLIRHDIILENYKLYSLFILTCAQQQKVLLYYCYFSSLCRSCYCDCYSLCWQMHSVIHIQKCCGRLVCSAICIGDIHSSTFLTNFKFVYNHYY